MDEYIKFIEGNKPDCAEGKHIPVAEVTETGEVIHVFCQECCVPMTVEQHRVYFYFYNKRMKKKFGKSWRGLTPREPDKN